MSPDEPETLAPEPEPEPEAVSAPTPEAEVETEPLPDAEADADPLASQPEPATQPDPTPVSVVAPSNRGLKIAVVALAALSFALAIVAATQASANRDSGRNAAIRRAAGAWGTAFLTYTPATTKQWQARLSRLSTGAFKKDFDQKSKALAAVFEYTGNSVRAIDAEIYLGDVDDKTGVAFVVVQAASSTKGSAPRAVEGLFRLDLLNNDGTWLVYDVTNYSEPASSASAAATTTSTTAATRR